MLTKEKVLIIHEEEADMLYFAVHIALKQFEAAPAPPDDEEGQYQEAAMKALKRKLEFYLDCEYEQQQRLLDDVIDFPNK